MCTPSASQYMPKNIILCFDGTANNFNKQPPTNILKLYKMLDKDSDFQMCYYQPGIGNDIRTGFDNIGDGGVISSKAEDLESFIDECVANSMDYHVIQAYTYLMRFYNDGDKIYIFGFSRGSFIGRILSGMIERIGLLNKGLEVMVSTAWEIYKKWELKGQPTNGLDYTDNITIDFKKTFCRDKVKIEFMGLWDSVNSCGIFRDRMFPFTSITYHVKHIRHAVSVDERRAKFKQNLFLTHSYTPSFFGVSCVDEDDESTQLINSVKLKDQTSIDMLEVWFPGDHCDVGGGWPSDLDGHAMSNIPLRWILSSAIEFGVKFKAGSVNEFCNKFTNLDSLLSCHHDALCLFRDMPFNHLDKKGILRKTVDDELCQIQHIISDNNHQRSLSINGHGAVEEEEESSNSQKSSLFETPKHSTKLPEKPILRFDCRGDDPFIKSLGWWLVEVLPIGYFVENKVGKWRRIYYPNLGHYRSLPKVIKIHWSVLWRIRFIKDYKPKNIPLIYQPLIDLIIQEGDPNYQDNRGGDDENEEDHEIKILTNENLIDAKTGEIKYTCFAGVCNKKLKLQLKWDKIPNDLGWCVTNDPNL